MKKSKLFILLPLVALTLTGCNNTVVSETTSEAPQESETTKDNGYSSYTLEFSFYYQGVIESLPSGSSIYYAGETNNWSFTPLKESDGSFKLDVGEVEYKTYEYKLLIEYDDKEVGWDNEKVVWPTSGGATNASFTVSETDGGSQSITCSLSSSLEDILTSGEESPSENSSEGTTTGDTTEGGGSTNPSSESGTTEGSSSGSSSGTGQGGDTGGSETFTYSIVLNNADALQTMEYDAALTEQKGVDLDISLVTTSSTGEVTTKAATYNDVEFKITGDVIIYFNELTVYPQASGETSFTISWPETTATPISVSVKITDVTQEVITSLSNYTLRFNFTYDSQPDTIPESAELRILGSWDNDDTTWSNYHVLTEQEDGSYTYTIEKIDVLTDGDAWYTYSLVLGYPDEEYVNWSYELTFVEDTSLSFGVTGEEGDNYVKDIALALSVPMSSIISDLISEYTLTLTITYNGSTETLPTWADLYIAGSWVNTGEVWDTFEKLTPNEARTEFTVTIHDVHPGYYNYDLVMVETGASANWNHQITNNGDGYFEITSNTTSGSTSYTSSSALETIFPNPDTVTTAYNYTVSFTITYNSTTNYQLNDYVALYLQGDFDGDGTWEDPMEMNTTDHITFSYTFSEITEESHQCTIYYNYTGVTNFGNDDWAMKVAENVYFTPNTTSLPVAVSTEVDINTALTDPSQGGDTGGEDEGLKPDATYYSNYTLTITLYDSDGHMKQCPTDGAIYMASGINGSWNTEYDGYWNWGDPVKLNENTTNDGVTYSYTYPSVVDGETYSYNLLYASDGTNYDWETDTLGTTDFSFTVDSGINDSYSQSIECTATSEVINSFTTVSGHDVDGYTLVFTIYDTSSQVQTCPSWGFLSLQGDFTTTAGGTWDTAYYEMTETQDQSGNTAYSVHFNSISAGTHSFNIMFTYTEDTVSRTPIKTNGNFSCTTADNLAPGTYYFDATDSGDIATLFPSHEGATEYNIYLCIVDTSNSDTSSINNVYVGSDDDIFPNNGDTYHNWDNVTKTTTTYNGNTVYAAYQSSTMTMYANDSHWAKFYDDNKSNYYFEFTVPDNMGTDICFVVFADCSRFDAWSDTPSTWDEAASGTWYSGTPAAVFATGFTVN